MAFSSKSTVVEKPGRVPIVTAAVTRRMFVRNIELLYRYPVVRAATKRRLLLLLSPGPGRFDCSLHRAAFSSGLMTLLLHKPDLCSHCFQVSVDNPWPCRHPVTTSSQAARRAVSPPSSRKLKSLFEVRIRESSLALVLVLVELYYCCGFVMDTYSHTSSATPSPGSGSGSG